MSVGNNAGPARAVLFTNQTAIGSENVPFDASSYTNLTFYIIGTGTINGGTILLEECDYDGAEDAPYGGTWALIGTITATSVTGNVQSAYHAVSSGGSFAFGFVPPRITGTITGGGSVSVVLRAV